MLHFKTISDLFEYQDLPAPENPLLGLVQYNSISEKLINKEVVHDFYMICLKKLESGYFYYGKTRYDSDKGFMYFFKPRQKLTIHEIVIKETSFTIYIHGDYLMGHPLFSEIKKYSFFDYLCIICEI